MKYYLLFILLVFYAPLKSQSLVTVSGVCKNSTNGAGIALVSIYEAKSNTVVFSDSIGRYKLLIPKGKLSIKVSYIGFKSRLIELILTKDTIINFLLEPSSQLREVNVVGQKMEDVVDAPQMGEVHLNPTLVAKLPALGGEQDIIKSIQLLPGVQNGEEGKSGLYVRGGGSGQNLILIEGIPIYDITHLGGFFSVFNTDAIDEVTLKKGSFPARYGGRLSSILDVKMKSGHHDKMHGNVAVGLFSSKLTIDGPIQKGKSSFMISVRRTYPDLIYGPIYKMIENGYDLNGHVDSWNLHFSDLNLKTTFSLGEKNDLSFFAFASKDLFSEGYSIGEDNSKITTNDGIRTGNKMAALRWVYWFRKRLTLNTAAAFTKYSANLFSEEEGDFYSENIFSTNIQDWTAKSDLVWMKKKHILRTGVNGVYHQYLPGNFRISANNPNNQIDTTFLGSRLTSTSFYAYLEDTWTVGEWKINAGLHTSNYGINRNRSTYVEPRIAARYRLSKNWSIKAAHSKNVQYVNLIESNGTGAPFNIWTLSTDKIVPQKADQTAIGVAMKNNNFEFTVDGYYKKMKNVLANKGGVSYMDIRTNWETKVVQGNGEAYGAEFFLNKKSGIFTGWMGYTLSWNWRQFDAFNDGKRFPYKYDRRHDIKIVLNYKKSQKTSFSAIWVYGTGNAVTLPIGYATTWPTTIIPGKYSFLQREKMIIYSNKNEYRAPAYHRLDLGVNLTKKKKRGIRTWSFGLYNAYARANPAYLYVSEVRKKDGAFDHYGIFRKSIFTLLPSISYSFKMN